MLDAIHLLRPDHRLGRGRFVRGHRLLSRRDPPSDLGNVGEPLYELFRRSLRLGGRGLEDRGESLERGRCLVADCFGLAFGCRVNFVGGGSGRESGAFRWPFLKASSRKSCGGSLGGGWRIFMKAGRGAYLTSGATFECFDARCRGQYVPPVEVGLSLWTFVFMI